MKFCMPMNEAKLFISSGPFDVVSFELGDGTASAMLRNTANGVLYQVEYLVTSLGDAACFLQITGDLAL